MKLSRRTQINGAEAQSATFSNVAVRAPLIFAVKDNQNTSLAGSANVFIRTPGEFALFYAGRI